MPCMPREYATSSSIRYASTDPPQLLVYENNGRILKCGHEVCEGEHGCWSFLPSLLYSFIVLQTAWKI